MSINRHQVLCKLQHEIEREDSIYGLHHKLEAQNL